MSEHRGTRTCAQDFNHRLTPCTRCHRRQEGGQGMWRRKLSAPGTADPIVNEQRLGPPPEPRCAEGKRDLAPANQVSLQGGANAVFSPVVLLHSSQRCGGGRDDSLKEHPPSRLPPCCHHRLERGKNWPPSIVQKLKEQRPWFPSRSPHVPGAHSKHFTYTSADSSF